METIIQIFESADSDIEFIPIESCGGEFLNILTSVMNE